MLGTILNTQPNIGGIADNDSAVRLVTSQGLGLVTPDNVITQNTAPARKSLTKLMVLGNSPQPSQAEQSTEVT